MIIPSDVLTVLTTLEDAGFEAYLVGGCVRDMLLGAAPKDYDVCTNAKPEQMLAVFKGFSVYETGLKHGTLTIRSGDTFVEATTYRIDGDYSDNRRPDSVTFVSNLKEDLARRDFTMNAISIDKAGAVIDFYGGKTAIENKMIAYVGSAGARFEEDSLRILRGLRFASSLGFEISASTAAAMREKKHFLQSISAERIREELTKLLCGIAAGAVLQQYSDILFEVLPELAPMQGFAQNHPFHDYDVWGHTIKVVENTPPVPFLRWAALLHDSGKPRCYTEKDGCGHFYGHPKISMEIAETILTRLKLDNKTKEKLMPLVARHDQPLLLERAFINRQLNQIGEENLRSLLLIIRADTAGHSSSCKGDRLEKIAAFEALLNEVLAAKPCFTLKQLAVNGDDLIGKGYKSGKEIGTALQALLNAVMEGKCQNNNEALLNYLDETQ
jgi:tRNA nucleotidyltransferase (CCA-adding enzyme)